MVFNLLLNLVNSKSSGKIFGIWKLKLLKTCLKKLSKKTLFFVCWWMLTTFACEEKYSLHTHTHTTHITQKYTHTHRLRHTHTHTHTDSDTYTHTHTHTLSHTFLSQESNQNYFSTLHPTKNVLEFFCETKRRKKKFRLYCIPSPTHSLARGGVIMTSHIQLPSFLSTQEDEQRNYKR